MPRKLDAAPAAPRDGSGVRARPVTTLRLGRIKASVWENKSDQGRFHNVTFMRTYRDEAKQFHDTPSFGRDDLPLVAKLADEAHTFIYKRLAVLRSETET